ncbi:hypothetical protein [Candidatus Sordicultor fermentans]|uniref:hypothetical protein n=1 Tax=Candidatus Sordicultor fermentans TaxID=1953203 RepID=UPI0016BA6159|nr:hypothetical protein [Candidatus Atribacteria bacterium]
MARKMGKKLQTEVSSESGMIDIFILVVVSFLLIISSWFLGNVLLHYQVEDAHIEKFKEEYKIEGALVEAIQLLKDKGSTFQGDNIPSSYSSLFYFSVEEGKLIISKKIEGQEKEEENMLPVAEVTFTWEENELKINRIETRYNLPYSK